MSSGLKPGYMQQSQLEDVTGVQTPTGVHLWESSSELKSDIEIGLSAVAGIRTMLIGEDRA